MACAKIAYATKAEAKAAARFLKSKPNAVKTGAYVYRCPCCPAWHLTSQLKYRWSTT